MTTTAAPVIPPIVTVPIRSTAQISPSSGFAGDSRGDRLPITRGIGPVLGGAPAAPIPNTQDLPRGQQAGPAGQPTGIGIPPPSPGPTPNRSRTLRSPTQQHGSTGRPLPEAPRTNGVNATPAPRPVPPSGLIGGAPGLGLGPPNSGPTAPRRVNPVGGVIGGGSAGTTPTGGAGSRPSAPRALGSVSGMSPIGGAPGTGASWHAGTPPIRPSRWIRDDSDGDGESNRWDPDHPWRTEQGVAPVVLPPDEDGPIDPGPALGLPR